MEKHEVRRKSTRTIPVIIENHENAAKKTKLMVPSNYTAGHLVNILRSRMHLLPYHPVYLFLKSKQSPVLMSKSIGHLHHKHRDEKGLLRLIHAEQSSFGFRGNIRAIRFRQKWIENLHNILHQDASAPESIQFSSELPPHFPLEPPSLANLGAPLDVDDLNESIEEMSSNDEFYQLVENFYPEANAIFLNPDSASSQSSDTMGSAQSTIWTNAPHSSTVTNSAHSFTMTEWADPWLSSSITDPWLPSAIPDHNPMFIFPDEESNESFLPMDLSAQNSHNNAVSLSSSLAVPNIAPSVQSLNILNPQVPPNNLSLYESDSDLYDSESNQDNDEYDLDKK